MSVSTADVREAIFRMTSSRPGKTVCPSEVARALYSTEAEWRGAMQYIRDVAAAMVDEGIIEVTQRGEVVDPRSARGPIRLRIIPAAITAR